MRSRDQVLLHRIALRERLVNVDWTRGSEVVSELRVESARALQAMTGSAAATTMMAGSASAADGAAATPLSTSEAANGILARLAAGRASLSQVGPQPTSPSK